MFTRLRELEKKYIYKKKEQTSYTQKSAARTKLKQNSYSRLHNKTRRILSSPAYDYQIVSNQSYTYQGQWHNNQKNGQGIAFLKNGTMIVGHWERDKLNGRSLIFTPYGALISAQFIDNKLNGWVLAQYSSKVIITNLFFQDRVDGPRIVFEGSQQFWIASNFTPNGQFIEIINVERGQRDKLPLFFQNDTLSQLFQNMVVNKKYAYDFQRIKCIELVSKTQYVGFLDSDNLPSGLGATYSDSECFSGNFQKGYLQDFGRMIFANGDIYHGGIITGAFLGNGIYYNPRKNITFVIDSALDGQTQVIQEQSGYYHLDFRIQIGERMQKQDTINLSHAVHNLLKNLEKYYHQYYIQTRIKQQQAYSNISEQQSQNMGINDLDQGQNSPAQMRLKKKSSLTKWIGNNSHQNGYSEEMSQQHEHSDKQVQSKVKYSFSPKNNSLQDYFSLKINQNEELLEKQKYQKQNPNPSNVKKNMFIAIPDKNSLMASKSLDIRQLTFRGSNKQELKSGRSGRSGIDENGMQFQYHDIAQTPRHKDLQLKQHMSEKNSSIISNMDQKLMGVMKKSNFRRKIFE